MSPIQTGDGSSIPDAVVYVPLPAAVTSVVNYVTGTVTSTRPAAAGEPASDANHFDDALQTLTTATNDLIHAFSSVGGGMRVYNTATSQWEIWPVYTSSTDPEGTPGGPAAGSNYVWLNTASPGTGGSSGGGSVDTQAIVAAVLQQLRAQGATF